jgi:hypothetical protein
MTYDDYNTELLAILSYYANTLPGKYADEAALCLVALRERNPLRLARTTTSHNIPTNNPSVMIISLCTLETLAAINSEPQSLYLNALQGMKIPTVRRLVYNDTGWTIPSEMIKPIRLTKSQPIGKHVGKPTFRAGRRWKNDK